MNIRTQTTIAILTLLAPFFAVASTFHGSINADAGVPAVVITVPVASPAAGTYTSAQSVTLSAEGASSIRFTLDGSDPACTGENSGAVFSAPVDVSSSLTIKALSCYPGAASAVVSFAYSIEIPAPASPPAPAPIPSGGGGGNGPIVGSLPQAGGGNAPAPTGTGGTVVLNTTNTAPAPDTGSAPSTPTVPPPPVHIPGSGTGKVAGAATAPIVTPTSIAARTTVSQLAAAASAVPGAPNYWWLLFLLLLVLLLDLWWILNSRKFKQRS